MVPSLFFIQPTEVNGKTYSIQWNLDQGWYEASDVVKWDPVNECCYWLIFFCASNTGVVSFSPLVSAKRE